MPQAVCCSDGVHCCPQNTRCNLTTQKCDNKYGASATALMIKRTGRPVTAPAILCPDHSSTCPSGTTCCQLVNGKWGCCPIPSAVCWFVSCLAHLCARVFFYYYLFLYSFSSDHVHCCPSGTTCDVAHGKCNRGGALEVPWQSKFPAKLATTSSTLHDDVVCKNATFACNANQTCCQDKSNAWQCCNSALAVCCR